MLLGRALWSLVVARSVTAAECCFVCGCDAGTLRAVTSLTRAARREGAMSVLSSLAAERAVGVTVGAVAAPFTAEGSGLAADGGCAELTVRRAAPSAFLRPVAPAFLRTAPSDFLRTARHAAPSTALQASIRSPLLVVMSEMGADGRTATQSLGLFYGRTVPSANCVGYVARHSTKRVAKGVARPSAKRVTLSGADGAARL